ncbi:MAG: hypothetical protein JSS91_13675 [Bacteroidetes bacterium]|nr:hypothetical protein [Bacteroidota bacterium]
MKIPFNNILYRVLISDDVDPSGIKILPVEKFKVIYKPGISDQDIFKNYSDFDVLVIRSIRKIDRKFLEKVSFKLIATCSKGTDHIDLKYAASKKIKIINAEEGNTVSAAEHTLALILNIYKGILRSDKLVREGRFRETGFRRNELMGKTIGIIGFGKVGSRVGKFCRAFGMNVIANDTDEKIIAKNKGFKFDTLNSVLKSSDIVSIHIPLNKRNANFFSENKLKNLKKDSVLINTSRGGIMDEKYLLKMLKSGKIRYAGLDVFRNEPHINKGFAELENVLLTNHTAGKTVESRERISGFIFKKINSLFQK